MVGNAILHHDIANHEEFVRNVLEGNAVARSDVDDLTFASWKRCRDDFGLDPGMNPEPVIVDRAARPPPARLGTELRCGIGKRR